MKSSRTSVLRSSNVHSNYKDESTPEIPSTLPQIVFETSASTCSTDPSNKKTSILVLHSSKNLALSLLSQLTLSMLMMTFLSIISLCAFSFPVAEGIKASSFYPSILYNARHSPVSHASNRNPRYFPNLPPSLPSIRETIPSSKSSRRASK